MKPAAPETVARLAAIVATAAGLGPGTHLDAGTRFSTLVLDSVVVLELLLAAEEAFQVALDGEGLMAAKALESLGSLAGYIEARQAEGA